VSDRFVGPLPSYEIPEQPSWPASWSLSWEAYDVPRLWDIVRAEGAVKVWQQVTGFLFLGDLLEEQYRKWRGKRDEIAAAWQSAAAEQFLARLDIYGNDLVVDSVCARQTSYALDRTVSALEKARDQIRPLVALWETATDDWRPEWWDHAAEDVNRQAREIMRESDAAIAASRGYIAAPERLHLSRETPLQPIDEGAETAKASGSGSAADTPNSMSRVPPMPGYDPLARSAGAPGLAAAPGAPQPVPAVPGQPVSMLPISPGSPYAPFGGAYILPGPGVGRGGYIVPMPLNPGTGRMPMGQQALMSPTASGGSFAGGMMPVPMAGGPGGGSGRGALYRRPNVTWRAAKGVPPIIRIEQDDVVPDQPSLKQEEEFRDWFTDLAYPWRAEFKNIEGAKITVRTVPE